MLVNNTLSHINISINNIDLTRIKSIEFLGIIIYQNLDCKIYIYNKHIMHQYFTKKVLYIIINYLYYTKDLFKFNNILPFNDLVKYNNCEFF